MKFKPEAEAPEGVPLLMHWSGEKDKAAPSGYAVGFKNENGWWFDAGGCPLTDPTHYCELPTDVEG